MDPRIQRLLKSEAASVEGKNVKVFVKLRRSGDEETLVQFREEAAAIGFRELDCVGEIVVGEISKDGVEELAALTVVHGVEQSTTYRMTGTDEVETEPDSK